MTFNGDHEQVAADVIAALSELLQNREPETEVLPLWNELLADGLPSTLTIGDLIDAGVEPVATDSDTSRLA